MLEEIHLAGSVRTFDSFCGPFADVSAVELGKAPVKWSGVKRSSSQTALPDAPRTKTSNLRKILL